jgi:hypothetical protein
MANRVTQRGEIECHYLANDHLSDIFNVKCRLCKREILG